MIKFTQMPNEILDNYGNLNLYERAIISTIVRKTIGQKNKELAHISISLFSDINNISKSSVIKYTKILIDKGIIIRENTKFSKGNGMNMYRLSDNYKQTSGSFTKKQGNVRKKQGSFTEKQGSVSDDYIKENNIKENNIKENNIKENNKEYININTAVVKKNKDNNSKSSLTNTLEVFATDDSINTIKDTPINHLLVLSQGNDIFKRSNAIQRLSQTSRLKSILKDYDYDYVSRVMMHILNSGDKEARWWLKSGNFNFNNFYKFTQIYRNDILNMDHEDDRLKYVTRCIYEFFMRFGIKKDIAYLKPIAKTTYEMTIEYGLDIFDKAIVRMYKELQENKSIKKNDFLNFSPDNLVIIIKDIEYANKKAQKQKEESEKEKKEEVKKESEKSSGSDKKNAETKQPKEEDRVSFEDINLNIFINLTLTDDIQYQKQSHESKQLINKDLIKLISEEDIKEIGETRSYKLNELDEIKDKYKDLFKIKLKNN